MGESVDELLAVGGLVCFNKGLAMGESVDELLVMGGLVYFNEGLAVGESVDKLLAVGGLVCFDKGLAVGELERIHRQVAGRGRIGVLRQGASRGRIR